MFLGKKEGGNHPKLGKHSTNSDLAQTFRVTSDKYKIVIGGEHFYPQKPKLDFRQKRGGEPPKIRQKFNQLGFGSNIQAVNDKN